MDNWPTAIYSTTTCTQSSDLEIDGLLTIAAMVDQRLGVLLLPDLSALRASGLAIVRIPLPLGSRNSNHWAGITWRFQPEEFRLHSHLTERYGAKAIADLTLQDWGTDWAEMEPFYDAFERIAGISGKAGWCQHHH